MREEIVSFFEREFLGVIGVRERELLQRATEQGLVSEHSELQEALEHFPVRIVNHRHPEGRHYEWRAWPRLTPAQGLKRLLGLREWGQFLVKLCETSAEQLHYQAWQFRDELLERGCECTLEEIEDMFFQIAVIQLPGSTAVRNTSNTREDA